MRHFTSALRRPLILLFAALAALFATQASAQSASLAGNYAIHYSFDDGLEQDHSVTLSGDGSFRNAAGGAGSWQAFNGGALTIIYLTRVNHAVILRASNCAVQCAGTIFEEGDGRTWTGRFTMGRSR